jgi:hypothetical protein
MARPALVPIFLIQKNGPARARRKTMIEIREKGITNGKTEVSLCSSYPMSVINRMIETAINRRG